MEKVTLNSAPGILPFSMPWKARKKARKKERKESNQMNAVGYKASNSVGHDVAHHTHRTSGCTNLEELIAGDRHDPTVHAVAHHGIGLARPRLPVSKQRAVVPCKHKHASNGNWGNWGKLRKIAGMGHVKHCTVKEQQLPKKQQWQQHAPFQAFSRTPWPRSSKTFCC